MAVLVPSARRALGIIAANRTGAAAALTLMAVTGTNGKTTTTYLLESMLQAAGRTAGVFGTIAYRAPGLPGRAAPLTTPGALMLHDLLGQMRAVGTTDVVLEATSHALEQGRLDGCRFRVAGLTNLTQDHLDYHGTMAQYEAAKAILFERLLDPARGVAVTFADDEAGQRMHARARGAGTLTVARRPGGGARADVVVEQADAGARRDARDVRDAVGAAGDRIAAGRWLQPRQPGAGGRDGDRGRARRPRDRGRRGAAGRRARAAGTRAKPARRAVPGRLRAHARRAGAGHRRGPPAGRAERRGGSSSSSAAVATAIAASAR